MPKFKLIKKMIMGLDNILSDTHDHVEKLGENCTHEVKKTKNMIHLT